MRRRLLVSTRDPRSRQRHPGQSSQTAWRGLPRTCAARNLGLHPMVILSQGAPPTASEGSFVQPLRIESHGVGALSRSGGVTGGAVE